jgi:hypothetical protein
MELAEGIDAGHLRAPGLHRSTREAPAEMLWGLRRSGNHRRGGIEVAEQITSGNVGCNSGCCTGRVTGEGFGKIPGVEVKLMRALAGSGAQ